MNELQDWKEELIDMFGDDWQQVAQAWEYAESEASDE